MVSKKFLLLFFPKKDSIILFALSINSTAGVNPRMLVSDQKITKNEDGSVIFECTANSLSEIAGWIVSRGEGVKVLESNELKSVVK